MNEMLQFGYLINKVINIVYIRFLGGCKGVKVVDCKQVGLDKEEEEDNKQVEVDKGKVNDNK